MTITQEHSKKQETVNIRPKKKVNKVHRLNDDQKISSKPPIATQEAKPREKFLVFVLCDRAINCLYVFLTYPLF